MATAWKWQFPTISFNPIFSCHSYRTEMTHSGGHPCKKTAATLPIHIRQRGNGAIWVIPSLVARDAGVYFINKLPIYLCSPTGYLPPFPTLLMLSKRLENGERKYIHTTCLFPLETMTIEWKKDDFSVKSEKTTYKDGNLSINKPHLRSCWNLFSTTDAMLAAPPPTNGIH